MPPKTAGPRPPGAAAASTETPAGANRFPVTSGRIEGPQKILLYGPGGIGKSSLARLAPKPGFLDIEEGTKNIDLNRLEGIHSFADLRAVLQSDALDGFKTVVVDSATKAEEWAIAHTLATVPHEKGHHVDNIEGYGFGKGPGHVYDTFLLLLSDLDRQIRAGRNAILIAHDVVDNVPNPLGDDWIRYEPCLQRPKSGKASIRNRVIQWADHVLYLAYDVVAKEGKGKGAGTRTIYPAELPTHIAKSRTLPPDPIPYEGPDDGAIWEAIFGANKGGAA